MQPEYFRMLKRKIEKRKAMMSLYYSKLELKKKLDDEIQELKTEVDELDKEITVQIV